MLAKRDRDKYIYIYISSRVSVITRLLFKRDDEAVYGKSGRGEETDPEIQDGKKGRQLT